MPEISIIVPVYNVEQYLSQCVSSIITQSYKDFELILVDDGSPDNCPAMCDDFAEKDIRIKVIHQKNGGLSNARNSGFKAACGKYIWFIDSDDYILENALKTISEYFHTESDIISFGFVNDVNGEIKGRNVMPFAGIADNKQICALANTACSSHLFTFVWRDIYNREFLINNNIYFVDGLSYAEDSAFNSKAFFLANRICYIEDCLYAYRERNSGISKNVSKSFDSKLIDNFVLYDSIRDENYEKYCVYKDIRYHIDASKHILTNIFYSSILNRIYNSEGVNKYKLFRKAARSKMVRKVFEYYDINERKSKSLDWLMFWFVKNRMYFSGHIICKYFLFK